MAEILTVTDLKKVYGKGGSLTRALDGEIGRAHV